MDETSAKKKVLVIEDEKRRKAQEHFLQAALTQHICRQLSLQTKTSQKKEQST